MPLLNTSNLNQILWHFSKCDRTIQYKTSIFPPINQCDQMRINLLSLSLLFQFYPEQVSKSLANLLSVKNQARILIFFNCQSISCTSSIQRHQQARRLISCPAPFGRSQLLAAPLHDPPQNKWETPNTAERSDDWLKYAISEVGAISPTCTVLVGICQTGSFPEGLVGANWL